MAVVDDFRAQWARQDQDQDFINLAFARLDIEDHRRRGPNAESTRMLIVELVHRDHVQYPQYKDYWAGDEWKLGTIRRTITTKGGTRFKAGDLVIFKDRDPLDPYVPECATAYSVRGQINCAIHQSDVIEYRA